MHSFHMPFQISLLFHLILAMAISMHQTIYMCIVSKWSLRLLHLVWCSQWLHLYTAVSSVYINSMCVLRSISMLIGTLNGHIGKSQHLRCASLSCGFQDFSSILIGTHNGHIGKSHYLSYALFLGFCNISFPFWLVLAKIT